MAAFRWCRRFLKKDRFDFFFYSNAHAPVHIHVRRGAGEAEFDSGNGVWLHQFQGIKLSDIAKVELIAVCFKRQTAKKLGSPKPKTPSRPSTSTA